MRATTLVLVAMLLLPPVPVHAAAAPPPFKGEIVRLSPRLREQMRGVSWHRGCPVPLRDLRKVKVTRWGFDGEVHRGRVVVHEDVARDVLGVFRRLYDARFKIRRMRLVHHYDGDDDASMKANNTSAFNCRRVAGTTRWSEHAYGKAIDINPVRNPYVRGDTVEPPAGRRFLDRSDVRKGMIVRRDAVVKAFDRIGWGWGGRWQFSKDYQHFSASGR